MTLRDPSFMKGPKPHLPYVDRLRVNQDVLFVKNLLMKSGQ